MQCYTAIWLLTCLERRETQKLIVFFFLNSHLSQLKNVTENTSVVSNFRLGKRPTAYPQVPPLHSLSMWSEVQVEAEADHRVCWGLQTSSIMNLGQGSKYSTHMAPLCMCFTYWLIYRSDLIIGSDQHRPSDLIIGSDLQRSQCGVYSIFILCNKKKITYVFACCNSFCAVSHLGLS